MSDIFISYKREDLVLAKALAMAQELERAGAAVADVRVLDELAAAAELRSCRSAAGSV